MNSQNVNTAASESSERWGGDPEVIYWINQEEKAKTAVSEISEAQFNDQLNLMYPIDWCFYANTESFKSMEMYFGNVTSIYIRCNNRFFTFRDVVMLTHSEIMEKVRVFIADKAKDIK